MRVLSHLGPIRIFSFINTWEEPRCLSEIFRASQEMFIDFNTILRECIPLTDLEFQTHIFLLITTSLTKCVAQAWGMNRRSPQQTNHIPKFILLSSRSHWSSLDVLPTSNGCQKNKPSVWVSLF